MFTDLGNRYPQIFRYVAQELAGRLLQRNALVGALREEIRILIVCSTEDLPIASAVQNAFASDPFTTSFGGTEFSAPRTTLSKSWRRELMIRLRSRDCARRRFDSNPRKDLAWPPRQRYFRAWAICGASRAKSGDPPGAETGRCRLPSDFAGVTTITYRFENGGCCHPACAGLQ